MVDTQKGRQIYSRVEVLMCTINPFVITAMPQNHDTGYKISIVKTNCLPSHNSQDAYADPVASDYLTCCVLPVPLYTSDKNHSKLTHQLQLDNRFTQTILQSTSTEGRAYYLCQARIVNLITKCYDTMIQKYSVLTK